MGLHDELHMTAGDSRTQHHGMNRLLLTEASRQDQLSNPFRESVSLRCFLTRTFS